MTKGYDIVHSYPGSTTDEGNYDGLTKRELFAAMAMQGILSEGDWTNMQSVAHDAVIAADALITALNKEQDGK